MTEGGLVLYYREGCHLCEEMAAVLFRGWPHLAERLSWRDVDSNAQWRERYGLKVPVLCLDDEMICEYFADIERLTTRFGAPVNPL